MKNKKMIYILGLLVLVVWGMILYRIFAAVNHNDDSGIISVNQVVNKEPYDDYASKKDTSKLLLHYRDPFDLVKDTLPIVNVKPISSSLNNIKITKPAMNWNFIKYSGFIRNPNSKKLIAIMNINGKNAMLAEGESAEDVKLLKNLKDSVKITYKKQTRFITMNASSL